MLADALRDLAGARLVDDDGHESTLELLPPMSETEIAEAEAAFGISLPGELREAMRVTAGFGNGPLESFGFSDWAGFGMEDVFPHAFSLGHDGFGNYWVLDLLPGRDECGPVFFACHDPPVIAYQSASASAFVREVVALEQPGPRSPVDVVHEDVVSAIWGANSGLLSHDTALASGDATLQEFASGLPTEAVFADLRDPTLGDGFSWGRFGPAAAWTRAGTHRLWAVVPAERRGWLARLFGRS